MVMPRCFSSGALSIWSKGVKAVLGLDSDRTLVMAAVNVVLPWSMWPMVPTFTWGFERSNFFLAISAGLLLISGGALSGPPRRSPVAASLPCHLLSCCLLRCHRTRVADGPGAVPPVTPARPPLLPAGPGDDLLGDRLGHLVVGVELHRVRGPALRTRTQVGSVAEHVGQRYLRPHDLAVAPLLHPLDPAPPRGEVPDH